MLRSTVGMAVAVLLAMAGAHEALAQAEQDRPEWASLGVEFGAYSPLTTFQDDMFGESSFETGAAIGFSGTVWPHGRVGLRFKVVRSETNGTNDTNDLAPLAVQDPTQWSFTGEVTGRHPMVTGGGLDVTPYVALGVGMRHYTWKAARHDESKFLTLTTAGGADIRPAALGPFGVQAEVRAYRTQFRGFGIHGGNWRPGTPAREVEGDNDIGFYGGVVDRIWSHELAFTVGVTYSF